MVIYQIALQPMSKLHDFVRSIMMTNTYYFNLNHKKYSSIQRSRKPQVYYKIIFIEVVSFVTPDFADKIYQILWIKFIAMI